MDEIRFYKGKFKVKVVTESVGYLTVEALEDFEISWTRESYGQE
jgi:hypothetical protein